MYYKRSKWSKTEVVEAKSPRKNYELNTNGDSNGDSSEDSNGESGGSSSDDDDEGNVEESWLNVGQITTEDNEGRTVTTYNYTKDGVLVSTVADFTSSTDSEKNTRTTTQNTYDSDGLLIETYVEAVHINDVSENKKTITTYGYMQLDDGKKFLATEMIEEYVMNKSGTAYELENTRVTTKSPTGRGQGATADNQGNVSASGNTGDDRITPYSKYKATYPKGSDTNSDTERKYRYIDGLTLIDTSFPIQDGDSRLTELTEAIKWLNHKTKETVTITLYEFPHVIDFNDRILFNGKEYFLVRNTATTTSRVFNEQQITLVRWF